MRESQGHLEGICAVDISPSLISCVTNAVMNEVRQWQKQPLEPFCGMVIFDVLM